MQTYAPSFVESHVQTCPTLCYDKEVQTCIISENVSCQIDSTSDIILRLCDEINSLKLKLQDYETTMNEFKIQKQNLYSVTSEDDQINVIDEILSKDVNNLKYDNFGYDIKNISSLSLDEMYNKQAPVLRKIIDCLTQNNQSSENNEMCQKRKLRKCLAIDLLISAKKLRYISPLSLAPMLLLYNATGSKTAVEIFSHTLPSGGYTFLQNWLLELKPDISISGKSESDLIYAFDNNQRLQKVWLSRNANKQTLEVMTNIIKLELTGYNNQKLSNLHPNLWRKFSNLDFSDNIFFSYQR